MNKNFHQLLKQFGLSNELAKIYLTVLEFPQSSMQNIADKSKIKRTSAYNFVKELISRRLILTSQKNKRIVYSAVHPNQLFEIESAKLKELQHYLPELIAISSQASKKPKVTFYDGVRGIKDVYADVLQEKSPMHEWSDMNNIAESLGEYYFQTFPEQRAKQKIPLKALVANNQKTKSIEPSNIKYLREVKTLPVAELKNAITIYANKVAMLNFNDNPYGVIIEDKNLSETLLKIWNIQWNCIK
jgi:sugar-specific transcriptional regulator TrmB